MKTKDRNFFSTW